VEKWLSFAGGLVGIWGVMLISQSYLGLQGSLGIISSMGSSAVLLFAVPHAPASQPWPVFGGHLVSAIVGVVCIKLLHEPMLAAAVAVAAAIGAMHYLRCIHPPGGATALGAAIGGDAVYQLGFQFVLTPVMLNTMTILAVALLFNAPFAWRRYPAAWSFQSRATASRSDLAPGPDQILVEEANE
jgi:CBS-domain-containing membrane protein